MRVRLFSHGLRQQPLPDIALAMLHGQAHQRRRRQAKLVPTNSAVSAAGTHSCTAWPPACAATNSANRAATAASKARGVSLAGNSERAMRVTTREPTGGKASARCAGLR